ncbi:MAG: zinc-binding dehydrogenase [Luteitalea sp.]|nr:zinc-binding dehydrogenase [Luteitalea sp.]
MANQSMKVWQISKFGLDALEQLERTVPQPGPNEILVKIAAVSLNYRDKLVVEGTYNASFLLPLVPASDAAGTVVALGPGVTRVRMGDRVIGLFYPKWFDGDVRAAQHDDTLGGPLPGMLAEYVVFHEQAVVAAPSYLDDREASTLPIAALTAWTALFEHAHVGPGQTVLVEGTGGVSVFGLQLASAAGARVIVTSSRDEKLARAKALGAWETINYTSHPHWDERAIELTSGRGVDLVLEVFGGDNVQRAAHALARGGTIALIGLLQDVSARLDIVPFMVNMRTLRGVSVGNRRQIEAMNRALDRIQLRPVIDTVYPFAETPAAFEHVSRGAFGKVVIALA